ncbi:MAG: AMP-binding protein [Opitutaceae bacterium]|jgi:acyl-[acyl-carrier-protein]-phospholipid O-acyltransferase/long-chain-fatty-acid--[acyl-carrier-protein] ligase
MKFLVRILLRLCFGFRAYHTDALKTHGPIMLIPNHVSWLDWLFLYAVLDDDWRCVVSSTVAQTTWLHRLVMINRRTFPVDLMSPYAVRSMTDCLASGGKLLIFAEGRISLSGSLMKLFEGTGFLIHHTKARVITCNLLGAKRLPWVKHKGWTKFFPRVSAHFSDAMTAPSFEGVPHSKVRGRLTAWLRDRMLEQQLDVEMQFGPENIPAAVVETACMIPGHCCLEDTAGKPISYRKLMLAVGLLRDKWRELPGYGSGEKVGVLLPNVTGAAVTLLSLWEAGKVPAMLNFSQGAESMLACARLAGLRRIITSRLFLEKARIDPAPLTEAGLELVFLEDVRADISTFSKAAAFALHALGIAGGLGGKSILPDDTAVVLFTSGSEGTPKGVELTHRNLLANIRQGLLAMDICDDDRFFNALPIFHSFGLTAGVLLPLIRGCYTFLYPSPLHYRIVPALVYDRSCTVLMGTNTFLNGYARKAHPYDFCTLRHLVAGAEKVQSPTIETYARKFGIRILEGYGATECSPIISLNSRVAPCCGSAGRLLPGMEYRLEPVEGVTEGGRLFVKGPNVMKGYLNADADARFKELNGWYDTGDIVSVDEEGFLHIQGRLKRFAKVSGEMVSLAAVEEALAGAFPQYGPRCTVAVVAKPDEDKGERLIAVANEPRLQLADIRGMIRDKGLSNLCAPRDLVVMQPLPLLGAGKVDHREILRRITAGS